MTARQLAFELLLAWPKSRRLADELLDERARGLPGRERALVQELFYGCLRQRLALDHLITACADRKPRPVVVNLLHLGLYQLHFLKLPAHAAVHETVELAKQHVTSAEAKFINAILRRADPGSLLKAEPWIRLSHPRWLWERHGDAWCEWNNQPPEIFARFNTCRKGFQPVHFDPATNGLEAHSTLCFRVINAPEFFASAVWRDGLFYIQDPSTLLAVDALDPQPGESVLDMCAAPGGKTTCIAQKMQNRGNIIAADSSNVRLGLVAENCRRLGVNIVATLPCEGTRLDRCLRGSKFDRVLLDAPCSNTGVMRRRPDLRWRIQWAEIDRLAALQRKLLAVAAQFVKPGGMLVYSTCSMEPEENEAVVATPPPGLEILEQRGVCPPAAGMDGAFYCKMRAA